MIDEMALTPAGDVVRRILCIFVLGEFSNFSLYFFFFLKNVHFFSRLIGHQLVSMATPHVDCPYLRRKMRGRGKNSMATLALAPSVLRGTLSRLTATSVLCVGRKRMGGFGGVIRSRNGARQFCKDDRIAVKKSKKSRTYTERNNDLLFF
uniref:Uncharacterized protein n=1 Tax=Trypanosoma congolense (strain IL3000) TaxID=1068625 RepID=F9W551_TRYCI|nr:hypothetical protein, unlikely [Trypanosoma congolense IL3000]